MASLMQPLPHGHTNDTTGDGTVAIKRYRGPDGDVRRDLEREVLERLQGLLPVPPVLTRPGDLRRQVTLGSCTVLTAKTSWTQAGPPRFCGPLDGFWPEFTS